jgi:glycosyltransferase involved in cell wall biosynthesis
MKILIVQDYLRSGGTERQSVLLAHAFNVAGHPTTLLTFRPRGALQSTLAPTVKHQALQSFDTHLDWFAPGLFNAVEAATPDLILCMGRMANCYAFALRNLVQDRWPRTAVVATMRTGKSLPYFFRRSLRAATHIVANSHEACATLSGRYGIPGDKISVIHNSLVFPAPAAPSSAAAFRAQQGATATTKILLNVAMFRPEKNQRELIHLAAGIPTSTNWQLWLAGEGPARASCEQLAAELGLSERVRFLGFLRDPAPLYAAADIAVHASESESLSNFLIEAQAHGLPAVAYDAQGIGECFISGHTGWVIPRDDRLAFHAALAPLFQLSNSARGELASAARSYARTSFDPARQVTAYLDLFDRLHPRAQP